jgi:hypothetical protein
MSGEAWITVWKTAHDEEAFLLKSFLESHGLHVFIKGQGTGSVFPDLPFAHVEVQVPAGEEAKARALVEEFFNWEDICTCESLEEAKALKEFLESNGLKVYMYLPDSGIDPEALESEEILRDLLVEDFRLQVPAKQADEARRLVELFYKSED